MTHLLAQAKATLPPLEGLGPLGNLGNAFGTTTDPIPGLTQFETTISVAVGVLTVSAGIWFVFQIFAGAYQWLASGGEKDGVQKAQKRITNAIVGLLVVVASYTMIGVIGRIFGLSILNPLRTIMSFKI